MLKCLIDLTAYLRIVKSKILPKYQLLDFILIKNF